MGSINYNITDTTNDTTDIVGLDNIKADLTLGLTQPFSTQGTNTIELKPVKADLGTDSLRVLLDLLREGMALKRLPLQGLKNHHFRRARKEVSLLAAFPGMSRAHQARGQLRR